MIDTVFIFVVSFFLIIKGATFATKYATKLAASYHLSKYTTGFIIIAIISILPETFISISSALQGVPSFGLGTLFGSNIADLTLIVAIILLFSKHELRVESKILKNRFSYPLLLLLPLILGLDGNFTRLEGLGLVLAGGIFYFVALRDGSKASPVRVDGAERLKHFLLLLLSMALLLVGSHFVVSSASTLAHRIGMNPVLIGMLIVGLGTTIPELFFSLKAVKRKDDSMAMGDILGTVLADATIVVGILAIVSPFSFPQKLIYVTGAFMVLASALLFFCMRTKRTLSKKEGILLFLFWLAFVVVELSLNN